MDLKDLKTLPDSRLLTLYAERFPKFPVPAWSDPTSLPPQFRSELVQALLSNQPSLDLLDQAMVQDRQRQSGAVF